MSTELSEQAREPLDRWRDIVVSASIPRSAREYAGTLHRELCELAATGEPAVDEVAASWRDESGTDRRGRALRILDRLGYLDTALTALDDARRRDSDSGRTS